MARELLIPDIGDFQQVPVIDILVKAGDTVATDEPLLTLESDKATMDVPAEAAGKVAKVKVSVGDRVSKGDCFMLLDEPARPGKAAADRKPESAPPPAPPEPAEPKAAADTLLDIEMPALDGFSDVPVIDVLVRPGNMVSAEDPLLTLESDKATMDVPSPCAGEIVEVLVDKGDKVSQGRLVGRIRPADSPQPAAAPEPAKPVPPTTSPSPASAAEKTVEQPAAPAAAATTVYASPSVWKIAREFGVDLTQAKGSGRQGRVLKEDVQAYVKERLSAAAAAPGFPPPELPDTDFSQFGEVEFKPMSRINQISGSNLRRNWMLAPHVTQFEEADITDLEQFRKSVSVGGGPKLTPIPFLVKASVIALKRFPMFNSSMAADQTSLVYKKYFHIGIAVDTPAGLMVPVIRDADRKGIHDIAAELRKLADKGQGRKLRPEEMQGGCFTISSLGGIGGIAFTPILNLPEVAILGVSRSRMVPKWDGKEFRPRLMLPLSLSYDHRVIDGVAAAKFTNCLAEVLSDIRHMAL